MVYVTTLEFNRWLNTMDDVPNWATGTTPSLNYENVGTGVTTTTTHYLDFKNVISGSLSLKYGSNEQTATALTETTDYTVDLDKGKISLTTTTTTVGSNIYATYKYNTFGFTDTMLREYLDKAQTWVDNQTNTHFVDLTTDVDGDNFEVVSKEKHDGKGQFRRYYYLLHYPVPDVNSALAQSLTSTSTVMYLNSIGGFATTGTGSIENEQITWSGVSTGTTSLTGLTRGANSSTAAAHTATTTFSWFVCERSRNDEGEVVSYDTLARDIDYVLQFEDGRVKLLQPTFSPLVARTTLQIQPLKDVPDRVRFSYPYGWSELPQDIKRCTMMIAAKDLMHSAGRRSTLDGKTAFQPNMLDIDKDWIDESLANYRSPRAVYL